jgi:threonine/homoserine/homoserine lactone efflux protein
MIDAHLYSLFLVTGISMAYSPGPSVLYTIISTWRHGRHSMLPRIAGQIAALIAYGSVSYFGVRSLMENFPAFLPALTLAGSLYLGYVAIASLRESFRAHVSYEKPRGRVPTAPAKGAFFEALMVGLSNPKIMLVYCVIIPQFTSTRYEISGQMAVLIISQWGIKSSSLFFYVFLADRLQNLLDVPERTTRVTQFFSVVLLCIAMYIGWSAIQGL